MPTLDRLLVGITTVGVAFGIAFTAPPPFDAISADQTENDFGAPEPMPPARSSPAPAANGTDALQWRFRTPIPEAVSRVAGVFDANGNFHLVCGNCNAHFSHPYDEIWDSLTDSWSRGLTHPSGSYGVHNHDVARIGDVIYVGGGSQGASGYYNRLTAIDLPANTWTVRASMPLNALIYYAFAAAGGCVYSFGGYNQVGVLRTVYRYDPATNAWMPRASMPEPRRSAAVAVVGDTIHVFGGMKLNDINSTTNTHWKYNWATNVWTQGAAMPTDVGWGRAVVAASPDSGPMVYLMGGVSGGRAVARVYRYAVNYDQWTSETALLTATRSQASDAGDNRILVVGGYSNGILSAAQEALLHVLDAEAVGIVAPTGVVLQNSVVDPQAWIRNNSSSAQTFDVRFTISDGYSDTRNVTLDPGDQQLVTFSPWTAPELGTWGTRCTTLLPGDGNPSNDQVRDTVSVRLELNDIQVLSIDAPTGNVREDTTIMPKATVKNNGSTTQNFVVRFEIAGGYVDTQRVILPQQMQRQVMFTRPWLAGPPGWCATRCTVLIADDNPGNNVVKDSVFVLSPPDVGVEAINRPDWSIVDSGTSVVPQATVRNYGSFTATFDAVFSIGASYSDRESVIALAPGDARLVSFASWTAGQRGRFTTKCTTELAGDANPLNDMRSDSVDVRVLDVAATAISAPTDTVDSGAAVTPRATVENYGSHFASFEVMFKIGTTYSSSKMVPALAPGTSRDVDFDPWTPTELGTFTTRCTTLLSGDRIPGNDEQDGWVAVRASGGGGDVGAVFINAPTGTFDSGQVVTPQATVHNYGTRNASFQVRLTIGTAYSNSKPVAVLAPGADRVVDFDDWTARERGELLVRCTTMLDGDLNNGNDLQEDVVTVNVHDMAAVSIVAPRGNVSPGMVTPQARIHNGGTVRDSVTVSFEIRPDGYLSSRNYPEGLPVNRDTIIDFDDWTAVNPGSYTAICSTWSVADQFPFNNVTTGHFSVGMSDVGVTQISAPVGDLDTTVAITPSAGIHNYGLLPALFMAFCRITSSSDSVVFNDTVIILELPGGADTMLTFRTWPRPHPEGDFVTRCSTAMTGDAVPDNDTLSRAFSITAMPTVAVWTLKAPMPTATRIKNVKDGGAVAYGKGAVGDDTSYVYAFKGNSTYEFYRYNTLTDAWLKLESIPARNRNTKKKTVKKGSSLIFGTDGKVYATKGNGTLDFWQYDPATHLWIQRANVPAGTKTCKEGVRTAAVREGSDDYVYLLKGSGTFEFYRYNAGTDVWDQTLPPAPGNASGKAYKNGSSIAYDGGDTIFCLKGSYNEFAAYSVTGKSWVTKDTLPKIAPPNTKKKKVKDGSQVAVAARTVYALKGGNTNEFWAFECTTGTWHTAPPMPDLVKMVKAGGALTLDPDGRMLYALRGNNTLQFWQYGPVRTAKWDMLSAVGGWQSKTPLQTGVMTALHPVAFSVSPNPFSSAACITYFLARPGDVRLELYDITGKRVTALASGYHTAGSHSLLTAPHSLASGVYLLKLETDGFSATSKLVVE